jgi:hypothetical protein
MADDLRPVITYPRDAIVEREHLQAALNMSREKIEKLDLPCFYIGRDVRFIWGQVLDYLSERAKANAAPIRRIG